MRKMTAAMAALGVVAGLGAAALPLSSYASEATVPVTAIIDDAISINITDATSGDGLGADGVLLSGVVPGGAAVSKTTAVTVSGSGNYKLTLEDRLMDTALISAAGDRIETGNEFGDDTTEVTDSVWGYSVVDTIAAEPTTWNAVPARGSAATVVTKNAISTKPTTYVAFGVRAAADQQPGRYTSDVIFTATSVK